MRHTGILLLALAAPAAAQCDLVSVPGMLEGASLAFTDYGHALATDGARLVVSTFGEAVHATQGPQPFHGAVWIHRLASGSWVLEQKLRGTTFLGLDFFGWDCAIDGDRLVVSAPGACVSDCLPGVPPGRVVFYERGSGGWLEVLRTTSSEASASDAFGRSLDLDGDRAVVGAFDRAFVFERAGSGWAEVAVLAGAPGSNFGADVALDGARIAVSAPPQPFGPNQDGGSVHVFEGGGGSWSEVAVLAPPAVPGAIELFGTSVALAGERLAVGAPRASYVALPPAAELVQADPGVVDAGAVFVFERAPSGAWLLDARVGDVEPSIAGWFGSSVALDGARLLAGAIARSEAHLFERTPLGWAERAPLRVPVPDEPGATLPDERFGRSVALAGGVLAVGAPGKDGAAPDVGAVYAQQLALLACATPALVGVPTFVPASTGGAHVLALDAGAARAGDIYLAVGSASGAAPGTAVGDVVVPLVLDAYTLATIAQASSGAFVQTLGVLDTAGRATAAIAVPPLAVGAVGLELHHAAVVVGPGGIDLAAGPARLRIVP